MIVTPQAIAPSSSALQLRIVELQRLNADLEEKNANLEGQNVDLNAQYDALRDLSCEVNDEHALLKTRTKTLQEQLQAKAQQLKARDEQLKEKDEQLKAKDIEIKNVSTILENHRACLNFERDSNAELRQEFLDFRKKQAEISGHVHSLIPLSPSTIIDGTDPLTLPLERLVEAARTGAKITVFKLRVRPEDLGTVYNLLSKTDLSSLTELVLHAQKYRIIGGHVRKMNPPLKFAGGMFSIQENVPLSAINEAFYATCVSPPLAGLNSAPAIIADLLGRFPASTKLPPLTTKVYALDNLDKLCMVRNLVHLILVANEAPTAVSVDLRGLHNVETLELRGFGGLSTNITSYSLKTVDLCGTDKLFLLNEVDCPDLKVVKLSGDCSGRYGAMMRSAPQQEAYFTPNTTHRVNDGVWASSYISGQRLFTKLAWKVHENCIISCE